MSLGQNIKRLRQDAGLTQGQLSKRCGIKAGQISKLERDEADTKISTIYKLMNTFNCSADTLLMDMDKVGAGAVMKAMLDRISNLPETNQMVLIEIIDKYCMAIGMQNAFSEENKNPLNLNVWLKAPEPVLSPGKLEKELKT